MLCMMRAPRPRTVWWSLATVVLAAGLVALAMWLRPRSAPANTAALPGPAVENVVVVTIDTLRADRVGAYGWRAAKTPVMDGLTNRGAKFDQAFATAPITLPSHASLLTGLYPPGHGARHNSVRVRDGVVTFASMLGARGWATGAFVGAFPLDRRFGLDQGFDRYGDRMPRGDDGRPLNERPGREVVDEAVEWVRGLGERRFFLWVHLFEPHAPYVPDEQRGPRGWTLPADVRYDDEVARADEQLGRLLGELKNRAASTLIILAGDHGEAFGEHGEIGHSIFLYDTTLRVPLIIAGPGVRAGMIVSDEVSLVDIFPTLVEWLGLPRPDVDGVSLVPLLRAETLPPRDLYAESFAPLLDFGWASLRSLRSGTLKYIAAPKPEMYDIERDPAEEQNLVDRRAEEARAFDLRVVRYSGPELPGGTPGARLDAETRSRLNALGYVSGNPAGEASAERPDPKDRRELAARIALVTSGELRGAALREALEAIVADDPRNGQAQMRLGYAWVDEEEYRQAERHFRAAIASGTPSADAYLGLGLCLASTGRATHAMEVLTQARQVEPGNPVVEANLGSLALEVGRLDEGIASLTAALRIDADFHQARFNLARALARAGRREQARAQARELLARLPARAPQRAEVERLARALR